MRFSYKSGSAEKSIEKLGLSARADRILKVSLTIADLTGTEDIKIEHIREGWMG